MKRLNYWQVHKNKKPKKRIRKKYSRLNALISIITAQGLIRHSIIASQLFTSKVDKVIALANNTIDTYNEIEKTIKTRKLCHQQRKKR